MLGWHDDVNDPKPTFVSEDLCHRRPLHSLPSSVNETKRLNGTLELACKSSSLKQVDLGGQPEFRFNALDETVDDVASVETLPEFDRQNELVEITRVDDFGLEIGDIGAAKHKILEFGVIDVDAAHLEKAGSAVSVFE